MPERAGYHRTGLSWSGTLLPGNWHFVLNLNSSWSLQHDGSPLVTA